MCPRAREDFAFIGDRTPTSPLIPLVHRRSCARDGRVFAPMSMTSSTSGAGTDEARSVRDVLGAPTPDLGLVHLIFEIVSVLSEHACIGCCIAPTASDHVWQVL